MKLPAVGEYTALQDEEHNSRVSVCFCVCDQGGRTQQQGQAGKAGWTEEETRLPVPLLVAILHEGGTSIEENKQGGTRTKTAAIGASGIQWS